MTLHLELSYHRNFVSVAMLSPYFYQVLLYSAIKLIYYHTTIFTYRLLIILY